LVLGKGVRAAGLFEATNQRLIGAFQKEQLNRDTLAPQLLKGIGKLTQRLVGTAVDDGGDALTPRTRFTRVGRSDGGRLSMQK
jgi:hypothetical protein